MSDSPYSPQQSQWSTPEQPGQPAGPDSSERNWAVIAHLGAAVAWLVGGWLLNVVIPIGVLLMKGDSAFVNRQAKEAINFQISLVIYFVVGIVLSLATLGIGLIIFLPALLIGAALAIVLGIVAAVKVSEGGDYRYPLTIRLLS